MAFCSVLNSIQINMMLPPPHFIVDTLSPTCPDLESYVEDFQVIVESIFCLNTIVQIKINIVITVSWSVAVVSDEWNFI